MRTDLWNYPTGTTTPLDVEGFKVRATDGEIGKIDEATYDVGSAFVVVDTRLQTRGAPIVNTYPFQGAETTLRLHPGRHSIKLKTADSAIRNITAPMSIRVPSSASIDGPAFSLR